MYHNIPSLVSECTIEDLLMAVSNQMERTDGIDVLSDSMLSFMVLTFQGEMNHRIVRRNRGTSKSQKP